MSEYVNREAVKDIIRFMFDWEVECFGGEDYCEALLERIDALPATVIVEEPEVKRGCWMWNPFGTLLRYRCSECLHLSRTLDYCCRNCGAIMTYDPKRSKKDGID